MLKRVQVDNLEKLIGQLDSLHAELSALAKKSPNDAVNTFKLRFVNTAIGGGPHRPDSFKGKLS